jgi:hypothetical protein
MDEDIAKALWHAVGPDAEDPWDTPCGQMLLDVLDAQGLLKAARDKVVIAEQEVERVMSRAVDLLERKGK